MERDSSLRRVGEALVASVICLVSLVTALQILMLSARRCNILGHVSLMCSGPHGLPWKSRHFVSSTRFLTTIAVCPFFLLLFVVAIDQCL